MTHSRARPGAGIVADEGEDVGAPQTAEQLAEVMRAERRVVERVGDQPLLGEGDIARSRGGRAVAGISCISPRAPTWLTAVWSKALSCRTMA